MSEPDKETVKQVAYREFKAEKFREAVEIKKQELREYRTFWSRLFPWTIIIIRRKNPWH